MASFATANKPRFLSVTTFIVVVSVPYSIMTKRVRKGITRYERWEYAPLALISPEEVQVATTTMPDISWRERSSAGVELL